MSKSHRMEEKELEIVKAAVEAIEHRKGKRLVLEPDVQAVIDTVERFISSKKLVCYGGTAINNIMPEQYRFYNTEVELPDYDFYSPNALEDAKELADICFSLGYNEVEAKSGSHPGTYKVFVNFMAIADITQMEHALFNKLKTGAYIKNHIHYAPTDFLRMAMYLELSRPDGDVSRWEKVLKRLTLLNKAYPMQIKKCSRIEMQRPLHDDAKMQRNRDATKKKIYDITQRVLMSSDIVFIGGFADILYSRYLPKKERLHLTHHPEFDVMSNAPKEVADLVKMSLVANGIESVSIEKMPSIGEIVSDHYKISVGDEIIVLIYKPTACHSYNTISLNNHVIKVASIDTMLMFYLAFSFADRDYYDRDRIMCLASLLFHIQKYNRLRQTGLLKRFGRSCYGTQETLESLRKEKANKYEELKNDRTSAEYQKWFLRYIPLMLRSTKTRVARKTKKSKSASKSASQSKSKPVSKSASHSPSQSKSASRSQTPSNSASRSKSKTRRHTHTHTITGTRPNI